MSLPAWSLPAAERERIAIDLEWPDRVDAEWAFGGSTGAGVRVCVLDSGIEREHPLVGEVQQSVTVVPEGEGHVLADDSEGDPCGHGTACAGVIRALAPDCSLHSVRVLGTGYTGSGDVLLTGLRWAVEQGFDVINMSLSTTKSKFATVLHELADDAYFGRTRARRLGAQHAGRELPVAILVRDLGGQPPAGRSAPPLPTRRRPSSSSRAGSTSRWPGRAAARRCTGNSFATPHVSALCALILAKHPRLTPLQVKSVLYLTSANVGGMP